MPTKANPFVTHFGGLLCTGMFDRVKTYTSFAEKETLRSFVETNVSVQVKPAYNQGCVASCRFPSVGVTDLQS